MSIVLNRLFVGHPITGQTRRSFIRIVALGTAGILSGCGSKPNNPRPDAGMDLLNDSYQPDRYRPADIQTIDITYTPPVDTTKPLTLADRLNNILKSDKRIILLNSNTVKPYSTPDEFLKSLISTYLQAGASLVIDTMEQTVKFLHGIESKLSTTYNVKKFFSSIELVMADKVAGFGGMANANRMRIYLCIPSDHANTKHLKPVIAHEYGHFLHFHDPLGNVVIPEGADSFPIDLAEMQKNGGVNRFHLKNIYFKPYLASTLNMQEYLCLVELLAHRAMQYLVTQTEAADFINFFLNDFYNTLAQNPDLYGGRTEILLWCAALAKEFNLKSHKTKLTNILITDGKISQSQITASLTQLDSFFNSIKVVA